MAASVLSPFKQEKTNKASVLAGHWKVVSLQPRRYMAVVNLYEYIFNFSVETNGWTSFVDSWHNAGRTRHNYNYNEWWSPLNCLCYKILLCLLGSLEWLFWTLGLKRLFIQKSAKMSVVKKKIRRVERISKFVPYALEIDICEPKSYEWKVS